MDVIGRLIAAVEASGLKRVRVAGDAVMSPTKLSKILNRRQVPTVLEFVAIARAISLDPVRLFSDSELIVEAEDVRAAHEANRDLQRITERLGTILGKMLPPQQPLGDEITPIPKPRAPHTGVMVPAAANPNAELIVEKVKTREEIPRRAWNRGARIIALATGDSMSGGPDPIQDGERAYLKPTRSPRVAAGRVALVRRGDGLYLKRFEMSGHTVRLVSTKEGVADVKIDARAESLQIYGYVVDHGYETR